MPFSIISLFFFAGQTFHWTDMQKVIFALVGWYNQSFGLIIICFGKLVFTLWCRVHSLLSWEKQFCFLSLIWFFRCKHPFSDEIDSSILACNTKHMAIRPWLENICWVCKFYWCVESVWLLLHKFWSHFGIYGVKYQTFQHVVPACIQYREGYTK